MDARTACEVVYAPSYDFICRRAGRFECSSSNVPPSVVGRYAENNELSINRSRERS